MQKESLARQYYLCHFANNGNYNANLYMKLLEIEKEHKGLMHENENLKKELTKPQADDILCLIDLSKKLNVKLKSEGESAMVSELMLQRAKVMDHFTLAYLADTGFKPSEIKLVQGMNNQTEMFEMYFEKITNIIL